MKSHCTKVLAENLIMHINWAHIFAFTRQSSIIFLWRLRTLRCPHPIAELQMLQEIQSNIHWGTQKPKHKKNDKLYLQQIDQSFRLVFRFASIHFPQNIFALNASQLDWSRSNGRAMHSRQRSLDFLPINMVQTYTTYFRK